MACLLVIQIAIQAVWLYNNAKLGQKARNSKQKQDMREATKHIKWTLPKKKKNQNFFFQNPCST
jgi:hypothetical protein